MRERERKREGEKYIDLLRERERRRYVGLSEREIKGKKRDFQQLKEI